MQLESGNNTSTDWTSRPLRILALEGYYGGSHKAFLDGIKTHSRHDWTILGLPANHWQWRIRHGAMTFAEQVADLLVGGAEWDLLFCSNMLNLAEFKGIAPPQLCSLPSVAYFHENQITYPSKGDNGADMHWGLINLTTALAADQVWFNTQYHLNDFIRAITRLRRLMPNRRPRRIIDDITRKSCVIHQGVTPFPQLEPRTTGPIRILWAARWEHDKNFAFFADAITKLEQRGTDYRLSVIGEQFGQYPREFDHIHNTLSHRIDRWGFQESQADYREALIESDIIVSTSHHEFFGISVAEAVAAGCYPVVPDRLAYPEVLAKDASTINDNFFYPDDATPNMLASKLQDCAERLQNNTLWPTSPEYGRTLIEPYYWQNLVPKIDRELEVIGI